MATPSLSKKELSMILRLRDEFTHTAKKAGGSIEELESKSKSSFAGVKDAIKSTGAALGLYFGAQALREVGTYILTVSDEVERLKFRLVGMKGGIEEAAEAFEFFRGVASTVPYSLGEVANAGVTLEAFGADTEETLRAVTDLAAFMGVDLVDAAQAFGRAWAGGAGSARVLRKRGVLNIIKEMRPEIEDLTKLTLPEFQKVLLESLGDTSGKFQGAAVRMADTLSGKWSMLTDATYTMADSLGEAGLSGAAKYLVDLLRDVALAGSDVATAMKIASKEAGIFGTIGAAMSEYWNVVIRGADLAAKDTMQDLLGAVLIKETALMGQLREMEDQYDKTIRKLGTRAGMGLEAEMNSVQAELDAVRETIASMVAAQKAAAHLRKVKVERAGAGLGLGTPEDPEAVKKRETALATLRKAEDRARERLLEDLAKFGKDKEELLGEQYAKDIVLLGENTEAKKVLQEQYFAKLVEIEEKRNELEAKRKEKEELAIQKEAERLQKVVDDLALETMTEEEQLVERYRRQQELYAGHNEILLLLKGAHDKEMLDLAKASANERMRLEKQVDRATVSAKFAMWGAILSIGAAFGKKVFYAQKALGIAEAVVNMNRGIAQALAAYPPPLSYQMARATRMQGMAAIAGIAASAIGGPAGGGGGGAGGGGAPSASAPRAPIPEPITPEVQQAPVTKNFHFPHLRETDQLFQDIKEFLREEFDDDRMEAFAGGGVL